MKKNQDLNKYLKKMHSKYLKGYLDGSGYSRLEMFDAEIMFCAVIADIRAAKSEYEDIRDTDILWPNGTIKRRKGWYK
jgi:hypothetical protein